MSNVADKVKEAILGRLIADKRLDTSSIKVETSDGRVVLKGTVPTVSARHSAEEVARATSGVVTVNNELVVECAPGQEAAPGEEMCSFIEGMLSLGLGEHTEKIKVYFNAGMVTLEGSIDSYWEKVKAEELVSQVQGVIDVNNRLVVEPPEHIPDSDILDDIIAGLEGNAGIDITKVKVNVESGMVTLSGTVPTWTTRLDAEDTARYSPGVKKVINNLKVE